MNCNIFIYSNEIAEHQYYRRKEESQLLIESFIPAAAEAGHEPPPAAPGSWRRRRRRCWAAPRVPWPGPPPRRHLRSSWPAGWPPAQLCLPRGPGSHDGGGRPPAWPPRSPPAHGWALLGEGEGAGQAECPARAPVSSLRSLGGQKCKFMVGVSQVGNIFNNNLEKVTIALERQAKKSPW